MWESFKAWVLKLFGNAAKDTDSAAMITRAELEYKRIDEINFDVIFGRKLANIAFSDATMDVVDGSGKAESARSVLVDGVLEWALANATNIVTAVCSTGGRLLIPYVHDGHVHCDIVAQERLYVISNDNERITSAAVLADAQKVGTRKYYRWVYYALEGGGLTVINKATDESGDEVPLSIYPAWATIPPEYRVSNVERMPWAYIKCPTANRDESDIYGTPITYGSSSVVAAIREHMKTIAREYSLTRPMLGLSADMWRQRPDGHTEVERLNTTVQDSDFPFIPVADFGDGTQAPWMIYAPAIRDGSMYARLDNLYALLEKSVGTSRGILTARETAAATATEIRAANHDTFTMVANIRRIWESAMDDLAYAVDVLSETNGLSSQGARGDYTISFDWDMSLFESSAETWQQLLDAQSIGAVSKAELRQWLRGGTLDDAQAAIDEIGADGAPSGIDGVLEKLGADFTGAGEE